MTGATEATLAELLATASAMNVNLITLQGLISRMSAPGSGGGGGIVSGAAGLLSSFNPLSLAFGVLKGAASAVGSVLGVLGNILGKVIGGFVDTGKNLIEFGKAAANGTAKLSDLYNAFKNLPFFIGTAMSLFADLIKYQEGLLKSYQDITKAGADFSGNLYQMREMAYKSYMSLAEFGKVVKANSDIFATAVGGVDAGIRKFTDVQNKLFTDSKLSKQILGLGLTAEDAGDYIGLYMRMQGNLGKLQTQTAEQTAKGVAGLVVELDAFTKLTGQNREELEKQMKEAAFDENLKSFLSNLSGDELVKAQAELAKGFQMAGKGGRDYYAQVLMTNGQILGPTTKAMQDAFIQTSGNIQDAAQLSFYSVKNFAAGSKESVASSAQQYKLIGDGAREFRNTIGAGTLGVMQLNGQIQINENISRTANNKITTTAEDIAKKQQRQYEGNAAALAKAELQIKMFGAALGEKFLNLIAPFQPILTKITDLLLNGLGTAITKLTEKDGPIDTLAGMMEEYLIPAIRKVIDWAVDTFKYLASGDQTKTFWQRVGVVMSGVWDSIKGPITTLFENFLEFFKPYAIDMVNVVEDYVNAALFKKFGAAGGEDPELRKQQRIIEKLGVEVKRLVRAAEDIQQEGTQADIDTARSAASAKINELSRANQKYKDANQERAVLWGDKKPRSMDPLMYPNPSANRHSGTLGMTGSWWEKNDATLNVQAGESVVTQDQMAQITGQDGVAEGIQQLNSLTAQLLAVMRQNTDYTQRNYNATKELGGNLFATV